MGVENVRLIRGKSVYVIGAVMLAAIMGWLIKFDAVIIGIRHNILSLVVTV